MASTTIAAMPERWRQCLKGHGSVDLRGVRVLSNDYYMFSDGRLSSKITAFFGSKALAGRVTSIHKSDAPEPFSNPAFKGLLYRLQDLVLDTGSLLNHLATRHRTCIYTGPLEITPNGKSIEAITLENGDELIASRYILAAGAGNGALISTLGLPVSMQLRPLHQVIVKGDQLPELFAHAVNLRSADKPRVTITTHYTHDLKTAWYLGGDLAESGVDRNEDQQISYARRELSELLPWIPLTQCEFSTYRIDRAEAGQIEALRPDTPYAQLIGNIMVCWPTKLTLVPVLGDLVLAGLGEPGDTGMPVIPHKLKIGDAPWQN